MESFSIIAFTFVTLSTKTPCLDFLIYIPLQLLFSNHSSYVNPNVLQTILAIFSEPFRSLIYVLKCNNLTRSTYSKDASFDMESLCHFTIKVFFFSVHKALLLTIEVQQKIVFHMCNIIFLTEPNGCSMIVSLVLSTKSESDL